jgi:hypothetical protein
MRIRQTHYATKVYQLKSWIVERSLDSSNWTEIDSCPGVQDF